ncbi:MAG: ExeM/NucH family extracellular endonuclease, partial [Anaerolineales bacterium]|nr:ExeM/NucH family extracellular endonuclease [Anaerolineales bacterium]
PTLPGGNLKIVSANVLNYFTTLDTGTPICGPLANQDCRGANDAQEFTRQRDKILNALNELNADIIGLIEIENHATDAALDDLVSGLNALAGPGTYAKISTGPIGGDAIKVALLYKTTSIAPIGAYAVLDNTFDPAYQDDKNRPALAQTFSQTITGEIFTVVVNHLKSKGSACTGDPDTGDGQGNCNQTRTAAANVLADWLTTDPTGSGDPDFLLLGDLNAYAQEDPITALETEGYTNLIDHFLGASAYSYVFDGQWGYLDYALANATMLTQIAGVSEWHINADEPITLDYNTEYKTPGQITSLYSSDPFRVSDHDPVVVGLYSFDFSDLIGSYGVAWHTGGGALRLGPTWNDSSAYGAGSDNSSDDGVVRTNIWVANASTTLNVTTNGAGYLAAWFDWDESGVFEADEKMIGQAIPGAGVHPINITVDPTFLPAMTIQTRFRFYAAEPTLLTPEGTEIPTGAGTGGEVEDYSWTFSPTAITLTAFTAQRGGGIAPLSLILLLGAGLILWRGSLSRRAEK